MHDAMFLLFGVFFSLAVFVFFLCLFVGSLRLAVVLLRAAARAGAPYFPAGVAGRQTAYCWAGLLASGAVVVLGACGCDTGPLPLMLTGGAAGLAYSLRPRT
jgi:hypothetical protein